MNARFLRAALVATIDGPVIHDGAVVVEGGRVQAVGKFRDLKSDYITGGVEDLGDVVLLPGLVNPHVHLE
ncbi:MAG: amidohydrolase family protein, partial [Tepidisphaeraceae bacterium]